MATHGFSVKITDSIKTKPFLKFEILGPKHERSYQKDGSRILWQWPYFRWKKDLTIPKDFETKCQTWWNS